MKTIFPAITDMFWADCKMEAKLLIIAESVHQSTQINYEIPFFVTAKVSKHKQIVKNDVTTL